MAPGKRSLAERLASKLTPEESLDPADLDSLGDETVAGRRNSALDGISQGIRPEKGRLRMRAKVPVLEEYTGKKVGRKEVFGDDEDDIDEDEDELEPPPALDFQEDMDEDDGALSAGLSGGFSITKGLEQEYQKMMGAQQRDLEVMRQPSAEDLAHRETQAKALKSQLEVWSSLVELRIHLEGALGLGHRLPTGAVSSAFRKDASTAKEVSLVAADTRDMLSSLMALQQKTSKKAPAGSSNGRASEESAWSSVNAQLEPVLEWALETADDWKEKTRLDARRSFKVLDQSFRLQMQVFSETEPEKLRKRCTPAVGKHKVLGAASSSGGPADTGESTKSSLLQGPSNPDKEADKEADVEEESVKNIFDDKDFYVQLLREVLASNSSSVLGASQDEKELRAELQGRRASKRKAKAEVERRASKGRKIRYKAIEKLQNFMASRPRGSFGVASDTFGLEEVEPLQDHACDAMLSSLFAPAKAKPL